MRYLAIILIVISSYADAIITMKEKNGTIISEQKIISKPPVITKTKEQEQKEALIKEQEEQSKKASEMVRNSLLQGFKEANKVFDEIEKSKKDVPNLIQKEKIIEIVK